MTQPRNEERDGGSDAAGRAAPVVVVGAGPVGVRFVQALHARDASCPVVLYGREPWEPYNRVQLSTFMSGETHWEQLQQGLELPPSPVLERRLHCEVVQIDGARRRVLDGTGRWQPYGTLVLATGSRARVPDLPGIGQAHVFVLRDLNDAQALLARRTRSVHTVVLGGGLLGLEAARAMQRFNTRVTVLEHGTRLMGRQLDEGAGAALRRRLEAGGLVVRTGVAVKAVRGHGSVQGVELRDGEIIACDTVIVAVGIVPELRLARDAGIAVGRGIRVDDNMRTSDPDVLALGECCEHREQVFGLVAPGLEQAEVAAHTVLGGTAHYTASLVATRLKVAGTPVFSIGDIDPALSREPLHTTTYSGPDGVYLAVTMVRGHLVGAVAVGPCDDMHRLQEAVLQRRRVWPWQRWRLARTGRLWGEAQAASVVDWPSDAIVCQCNQVCRGPLGDAIAQGNTTVAALGRHTRAGTVCGSCRPLLAELLQHGVGNSGILAPVRGWRTLAGGALASAMLGLLLWAVPGWAYWETVQGPIGWQRIWTDATWKQLSGYAVLALAAVGLTMSLRKRVSRLGAGDFDLWRVAHGVLGAAAMLVLAVHTGARLGAGLDFALVMCFVGLTLVGAAGACVIAGEHRLRPALVRRWRQASVWTHIVLSWPVPVLLALHIVKSYWF